jgi:hypothetical protein
MRCIPPTTHIISWFGLSVAHESLYDTILDLINVNHGETSLAVAAL